MPSGFTSKLNEGPQSFRDFALRCARGMGATVTLRDQSLDAPIPDIIEPHDYHARELAKARAELADVETWDDAKCEKMAVERFERDRGEWLKSEAAKEAVGERYRTMIEQVKTWSPPTPEHEGMRRFMLEQLEQSLGFDCCSYPEPIWLAGPAFKGELLERLRRDIDYHTNGDAEERQRAAERTRWLSALRGSLPQ